MYEGRGGASEGISETVVLPNKGACERGIEKEKEENMLAGTCRRIGGMERRRRREGGRQSHLARAMNAVGERKGGEQTD